MPSEMCYAISYPFPNFDGATIDIRERISNYITLKMDLITYLCWNQSQSM